VTETNRNIYGAKGRVRFRSGMQELAANEEVKAKYLMI
jgi:hypothetical protein